MFSRVACLIACALACSTEFRKVLDAKDFGALMIKQGGESAGSTPEELAAFVKSELRYMRS